MTCQIAYAFPTFNYFLKTLKIDLCTYLIWKNHSLWSPRKVISASGMVNLRLYSIYIAYVDSIMYQQSGYSYKISCKSYTPMI